MKPACLCLLVLSAPVVATASEPARLEPVTVTANRVEEPAAESVFSITRLDGETIEFVGATHANELFARVPGAWVSRGSGQEHLTAIRSPVLTGAGACGAFLFLEDGIPVRPAGFCNVNQLFEINTEQADAIEVLRGPGSVAYGSNAVHGVINVLHTLPAQPFRELSIDAGEFGYRRLRFDGGDGSDETAWRAKFFSETSDSVQVDAGHTLHKLNLGWQANGWRLHLAATSLDQDTAGYIEGRDAYRDPEMQHANPNLEAFRKADSVRAWAVWQRRLHDDIHVDVRPYVRYSDMDFLQHFLPGKPLEENGQTSAGVISSLAVRSDATQWRFGLDVDWADGWLKETQDGAAQGSAFLRETRPAGRHYDYTARQHAVSPWASLDHRLTPSTHLIVGARADWIRYDYDNRMAAGNAREDGSLCGQGGCIYNRPADRSDTFSTLSPKFGLRHLAGDHVFHATLLRGFRVPQATELYRLQRGQDIATLEPVRLDSAETGVRGQSGGFSYDVTLFVMEKRNLIFRDAEGFNVSSGRTRHRGIELDLGLEAGTQWTFALRGTLAKHVYAFDYAPADGERFAAGDDVDTAPRVLGSALARWTPTHEMLYELEYAHVGAYWLDAENTARYPGHGLWHLRWHRRLGDFGLTVRVMNLLDEDYAERADLAFGNHRYFPGWPRRANVTLTWNWR